MAADASRIWPIPFAKSFSAIVWTLSCNCAAESSFSCALSKTGCNFALRLSKSVCNALNFWVMAEFDCCFSIAWSTTCFWLSSNSFKPLISFANSCWSFFCASARISFCALICATTCFASSKCSGFGIPANNSSAFVWTSDSVASTSAKSWFTAVVPSLSLSCDRPSDTSLLPSYAWLTPLVYVATPPVKIVAPSDNCVTPSSNVFVPFSKSVAPSVSVPRFVVIVLFPSSSSKDPSDKALLALAASLTPVPTFLTAFTNCFA